MKVKVISRNPDVYMRQTKTELHRAPRNYDPKLHPLEAPREYTRALNAVKLDRVFAKPFIANLEGHKDGVACIVKHPKSLSTLISAAYDGEICMWNIPARKCQRAFVAHQGVVRGLTFTADGNRLISIGDDKTIKFWNCSLEEEHDTEIEPNEIILSSKIVSGISHHRSDPIYATCGEMCQLWEETRNEPIRSFQWGVDSLHDVQFNPVQRNLLATCASDRSVILYDMRESMGPVRKVVMQLRTNRLCWNPMEAFIFTCANEDNNLYTFDTRRLRYPINVHKDHVAAVTDLDYAPTGKEFVTGSYDKTIRIFETGKGHSREIYHTKRMQRLTCVQWSLDNKYIFSGSDEMNIRIWKARASEKLGVLRPRERSALHYNEALRQKFAAHPQIKRIARHRQVPKHIHNAQNEMRAIRDKRLQKDKNRRSHSKPGTVPFVAERKKHTVKEEV